MPQARDQFRETLKGVKLVHRRVMRYESKEKYVPTSFVVKAYNPTNVPAVTPLRVHFMIGARKGNFRL